MSYRLQGRLLEVCNCKVLCPCWIGEDPDYGTCHAIVAWHIDKSAIDVSGHTLAGEVLSIERAPIRFTVNEGKGELAIGENRYAELEPYRGPSGATTTLTETIFTTVPGAPAFVAKAPVYRSHNDTLGIHLDMRGHSALQSTFVFEA